MGRFFANQKLDEAGVLGVTLQKLLIFFMILDVLSLFCGVSFFGSFMTLIFHFVVFMGVYRRRTCVLLMYVVIHVAILVLAAVALVFVVSSLMFMAPSEYGYDNSGSADVAPIINNHTFSYNGMRQLFSRYDTNHTSGVHPTPNNKTIPQPPKNNTKPVHPTPTHPIFSSSDISSQTSDDDDQGIFLIGVIVLLLCVVILYTKILSVVLAHRMRKVLLAKGCGLPVCRPVNNECDAPKQQQQQQQQPVNPEPIYVPSEDFENMPPYFNQPGFMPYQPMVPQNFYPGQAPNMPPFMQPVFYTFAPVPQHQQQQQESLENEKL